MNYEQLKIEMEKYSPTMTVAERRTAYAKGEEVDHIPISLPFGETLGHLYGYSVKQYNTTFESRVAEIEFLKAHPEFYGGTTGNVVMGLRGIGEAVGSVVKYPENSVDYVEQHVLTDWDMLPDLEKRFTKDNPFIQSKLQMVRQYKEKYGEQFPVITNVAGPISTAVAIRKPELFLRDMIKNPEKAHELLDLSVRLSIRWLEFFAEEFGAPMAGFSDPVSSMNLISPKQFREFCTPHLQDLLAGFKRVTGMVPGVHICGKTKPVWDEIASLGMPSFSVDNCEDLEELKLAIGDKMAISGNVPPVEVMRNGSIDDVIEAVKICLEKGSDNPKGYTLGIGCQLPVETPLENLHAFIYAARKYGGGAKLGCKPKGLYL